MKPNIFIASFILVLLLSACQELPYLDTPYTAGSGYAASKSFIPEYDYYDDTCLLQVNDTSLTVKLLRSPIDCCDYTDLSVNILSRRRRKAVFDSIAAKHNDVGFDTTFFYYKIQLGWTTRFISIFKHNACMVDISSITVRSSEAWDEAHPAGEPLDDIVLFDGTSVYPFIASGYSPDVPRDYAITKPLTSMEAEDYYMVLNRRNDWTFRLRFARRPTVRPFERRTLTVEITFDDGSVLTSSVEADFILRRQEGA